MSVFMLTSSRRLVQTASGCGLSQTRGAGYVFAGIVMCVLVVLLPVVLLRIFTHCSATVVLTAAVVAAAAVFHCVCCCLPACAGL